MRNLISYFCFGIVVLLIYSCHSRNSKDRVIHIKDEQYTIEQQEISMDSIAGAYLHLDKIGMIFLTSTMRHPTEIFSKNFDQTVVR